MVSLGKLLLAFLAITSLLFSQQAPVLCQDLNFFDSYLFSTFDQTNLRVDVSFLYSQLQNGVETRLPVSFAPVYVYLEEEGKLPRLMKIITDEEGKASLDVSSFQANGRASFIYPSGIDPINEFKSVGIDLNAFGINDLSAVPCFEAGMCPPGIQDPVSLRSAFSRTDVQIPQSQIVNGTPPFCLPLILIFALLGGAMYLSGRNPLSLFDFSSPRMGKVHQFSARTRSISFDSSSAATGAIKLGRVATDAKGVKQEEKQREAAIKERTGIKSGFIAMTLGQGMFSSLVDKQVGLRAGFGSLKGKNVSKRTDEKSKKDTPSLKSPEDKKKEKPEVDSSHFGFTPERMEKLKVLAQRDTGIAGLLGAVINAPRGQRLDALNESLVRGLAISPIFYAISADSITKLTRTVNEKEALELVAGGALVAGKTYEGSNGKKYTLKTTLSKSGAFVLVLVEGKDEKPATNQNVPESVRREALLDIVEKVALGASSLATHSGNFQAKQDEAKEKIASLLENPKIAEAVVGAMVSQYVSAKTAPEKNHFGDGLFNLDAGSLVDKNGKPVDAETRNHIMRDGDSRERLAEILTQNPAILNKILSDASPGSLGGKLDNSTKQELVFSAALATAAYSQQIEYSALNRLGNEATALLTRMDTDKSYKPSAQLIESIGEAGVQATSSNIKATAALDGFQKALEEFQKNPNAAGAVSKLAEATQGLSISINDKLTDDLKFQMTYRLAQYDQVGNSISILDQYTQAAQRLERDIHALKEVKDSLESARPLPQKPVDSEFELVKLYHAISTLENYQKSLPQEEQAAYLAMLSALPKQDGKISESDAKYYGTVIGALEVINEKYTYSSPEVVPSSLNRINELKEVADFRNAQASLEVRKDEAKEAKDTDALADINRQIQELNEQYRYEQKNLKKAVDSEISRVSDEKWTKKDDPLAFETPYLFDSMDREKVALERASYALDKDLKDAYEKFDEVEKKLQSLPYGPLTSRQSEERTSLVLERTAAVKEIIEMVFDPHKGTEELAELAKTGKLPEELKHNFAIAVASVSEDKNLKEIYGHYIELKEKSESPSTPPEQKTQIEEDFKRVTEGIQKEVFSRPKKLITDDVVEDLASRQEALSKRENLLRERPTYDIPPSEEYLTSQFAQGAGGLSEADITTLLKARASKPQ